MTYSAPVLQIVGAAKRLVLGTEGPKADNAVIGLTTSDPEELW